MEFFKHNTTINFMAQRKWAAIFSIILFLLSIASLLFHGLNWGLDFTGGTQIQLSYPVEANLNQIRLKLENAGYQDAVVMSYGTSRDVLITLVPQNQRANAMNNKIQSEIVKQVTEALPEAKVDQVSYIGPQVGKEMASKSVLAILFALLGTMVYIAFRFDFRFAVGSTVALIHDPIIILGIFSFFNI